MREPLVNLHSRASTRECAAFVYYVCSLYVISIILAFLSVVLCSCSLCLTRECAVCIHPARHRRVIYVLIYIYIYVDVYIYIYIYTLLCVYIYI